MSNAQSMAPQRSRWEKLGERGVVRGRGSEWAAMAVCVLLVGILFWLAARTFWLLLAGDELPASAAASQVQVSSTTQPVSVSKWHLFGSPTQPVANARTASATTLALSLRGTLADANPKSGMAVIADEQGVERAWRVGDPILPGVTLDEVYSDRVVLLHEGVQEVLPLMRDETPSERVASIPASARGGAGLRNTAPASSVAPAMTFTPPQLAHGSMDWQKTMDNIAGGPGNAANLANAAKNVRIEPVIDNGKIAGVRVSASGGDAAMLSQLGLRPSDIVTAVNGLPVDSVARGQQIAESLGSASSVRVTVTRDGVPTEITVKLR